MFHGILYGTSNKDVWPSENQNFEGMIEKDCAVLPYDNQKCIFDAFKSFQPTIANKTKEKSTCPLFLGHPLYK